jgi:hypothetical protein
MKKVLCLLMLFVSGCASIIHGNTEQIGFTSDPSGATLQVASNKTTTPAFIILPRRGKYTARFTKEGYEPAEVQIKEGMSLWFLLGNLGFGGIPGWIIDAINGSVGDLSPDNVHVNLVPIEKK